MADELARARLARAAAQLNRGAATTMPALVFLTDDERVANPIEAIHALPRGSLVILRARQTSPRAMLAEKIARAAHECGLYWLVADDPALAVRMGAHGAHFPEAHLAYAHSWRARRPWWLITCAVHSLRACARAAGAGADAAVLAPVFATESHAGRETLGPIRARFIARQSPVPVYALGGIEAASAARLRGANLAGLAGVGALAN